MARLFVGCEVIDDWHPLSGVAAPVLIPVEWHGPHVELRYGEAWKTLLALPDGGPSRKAGQWPEYITDYDEAMARCGGEAEWMAAEGRLDSEYAEKYRQWRWDKNKTREPPDASEISKMERSLEWPWRYLLGEDHKLVRALNLVGWAHGAEVQLRDLLRRHKPYRRFKERDIQSLNWQACDLIADGLNANEISPW